MVLCPATYMKCSVMSHAAWSDVQAKDQSEHQGKVLHNLKSVQDVILVLIWQSATPVSCQFLCCRPTVG